MDFSLLYLPPKEININRINKSILLMNKLLTSLLVIILVTVSSQSLMINAQEVIHCWDFNDGSTTTTGAKWPSPIPTSARVVGNGTITHTVSDTENFAGSVSNACEGSMSGVSFCPRPGTSLVNNGSNMTMSFPTTGYENIGFSFWFQRTSTGFNDNSLQISTNGGVSFTEVAIISLGATNTTFSFNFDTIPAANDNPNFQIRIVFLNGTGSGGNNRFDNLTLTGTQLEEPGECSINIANILSTPCIPSFGEGSPTFNFEVTVSYSNEPNSGSLVLNVSAPNWSDNASVPVGALSNPYTFSGLSGIADGLGFQVTAFFSDNSGCLAQESAMAPDSCGFEEGDCEDLIFSEYIEGTSTNKALELYNTGDLGIDLAAEQYYLQMYFNGSNAPAFNEPLSGIVPAGGTFVIAPTNATAPEILNTAAVFIGDSWFNGDDDVVLRKGGPNGPVVDRIGQVGTQINFGMDVTLRRKFEVAQGDTDINGAFTVSNEWDAFPTNDFSGLGEHSNICLEDYFCPIDFIFAFSDDESEDCFPQIGRPGSENSSRDFYFDCFVCNDNGTFAPDDDFFEFNVEVGYYTFQEGGLPESGFLILYNGGQVLASVHVSELFSEYYHIFSGLVLPADGSMITLTAAFSDIPGCIYSDPFSTIFAPEPCSFIEDCSLPFISEYIEGTSNNKCIEIYNPTEQVIDLAAEGYQLLYYFNGNINPGLTINLTGTVGPYGTHVVCNSSSFPATLIYADQIVGGAWYNGDDDIELRNSIGRIDFMGNLGVQQSFGQDVTLRRKSFIAAGNPSPAAPFDRSIEWDVFPVNTVEGLKFHRSDCAPNIEVFIPVRIPQSTDCGGTVSGNTDPLELNISSSCWGDMIGRHATMYVTDHCGDFDISAKVEVTPFGFAGIMVRENLIEDTKTMYMYVRGNGMIHWSIRNNTNPPPASPNIQIRPMINNQYMRMKRTGNLFEGFISTNGVTWNRLFQSQVPLNSCLYVGFGTHSHCNNPNSCLVESSYTEINHNLDGIPALQDPTNGLQAGIQSNSQAHEVTLSPNPAGNFIDLTLPNNVEEDTEVLVLDITGKVVLSRRLSHGSFIRMDLNDNMPDGMYLVTFRYGHELITKRFVKSSGTY
jgi:hypothetical protein